MTAAATAEVVDLLADLVRIDSTSGTAGETAVLVYVADWLRSRTTAHVTVGYDDSGQPVALLATRPSDRRRAPRNDTSLVFACHADVVPVSDPGAWTTPPFEPTCYESPEHGGRQRMRGRGASDMKSGLAAALSAFAELFDRGTPVALALSTGEEVGSRGAPVAVRLLEAAGVAPGAVVIPESTDNRIARGHRGALWLRVSTTGLAAHGSTPERGRNAVVAMARILDRLDEIPLRRHPDLGAETTNVGTIEAGSVPNIVPDRCTVRVDHRVVDAQVEPLLAWWRSQPDVSDVEIELDLAPVWTPPRHPWLQTLPGAHQVEPVSYFTDASVFVRSWSTVDVPVVVWGPGDPTTVHAVDESVDTARVIEAVGHYVTAGEEWAARSSGRPA